MGLSLGYPDTIFVAVLGYSSSYCYLTLIR
jgi:hypothetical protein